MPATIRLPKRSKYRAVPVTVDGHRFPSKREAARYGELRLLERNGKISDLVLQPRFPCIVNGRKVCVYVADFGYLACGVRVIEDCKGFSTQVYKLKRKLVEALYGGVIQEV